MPRKNNNDFVDWRDDWRNCRAKKMLLRDLEKGRIPLSSDTMTAEAAQQLRPEYQEVEFKKFKRNFEALRKSFREEKARATRDSDGLARDKQRRALGQESDSQWNGSDAQKWLQHDVKEKKHMQMTPRELWESRSEYKHVNQDVFRNHIYKEEQRQKRHAVYERKRAERKQADGSDSD
jgi:hypothetical protein